MMSASSEYLTSQPSGNISPSVSSSTGLVFHLSGASAPFGSVSLSMSYVSSFKEPSDGSSAQRPLHPSHNGLDGTMKLVIFIS